MAVHKRISRYWAILLAAVCLATVLAALGVGSAAFGKGAGKSPPPSAYGVQLDPNNLPGVYDQLPAEKRALIDRENAIRNTAAAEHPLSKRTPGQGENNHPTPRPAEIAVPHRAAGAGLLVEEGCGQDVRSGDYNSNQWSEKKDTGNIRVCSGATEVGGPQGALLVLTGSGSTHVRQQTYPSPALHGTLRIVGAEGELLEIRALDGTSYYFDVSRLAYVDGPPAEGTRTPKPSP